MHLSHGGLLYPALPIDLQLPLFVLKPSIMSVDHQAAAFDDALKRRQALMGDSGPRGVLKNLKVFRIAAFACLGGLLYGYNQVRSQILRPFHQLNLLPGHVQRHSRYAGI